MGVALLVLGVSGGLCLLGENKVVDFLADGDVAFLVDEGVALFEGGVLLLGV